MFCPRNWAVCREAGILGSPCRHSLGKRSALWISYLCERWWLTVLPGVPVTTQCSQSLWYEIYVCKRQEQKRCSAQCTSTLRILCHNSICSGGRWWRVIRQKLRVHRGVAPGALGKCLCVKGMRNNMPVSCSYWQIWMYFTEKGPSRTQAWGRNSLY